GITLLRLNRLRITSHPSRNPDLPGPRATRLHQDNQRLARLPSCVTPSLAYYRFGSHAPPTTPPEGSRSGFGWSASPASTLDALSRAREYQPVVHRLRL